jgi:hypothetical protein
MQLGLALLSFGVDGGSNHPGADPSLNVRFIPRRRANPELDGRCSPTGMRGGRLTAPAAIGIRLRNSNPGIQSPRRDWASVASAVGSAEKGADVSIPRSRCRTLVLPAAA